MRKLTEATLVTLDGVIGDPHVWAAPYFDDVAAAAALEQLEASDAMLMGRRTYDIFSAHWPEVPGPYAARLNAMRKYVFSSTLERADWTNTTIVRGDVPTAVAELKAQDGPDLVMYGHGRLGLTLLEHGLLDEVRLAVHPVVVGRGTLFFAEGANAELELVGSQAQPTGVVWLTYRPVSVR